MPSFEPLRCPDHPTKELEFYNPHSRQLVCSLCCATGSSVGVRCQDIPTAVAEHQEKFAGVAKQSNDRHAELEQLESFLNQQISIVDLREKDTIRKIHQESERLIQLLKRRDEELTALVAADTEMRRAQLEQALSTASDARKQLTECSAVFQETNNPDAHRLQALYQTERQLNKTSLFLLPDLSQYNVASRAIVPEAHLTLSHQLVPMHAPGLSIALSERQASFSPTRNAAGGANSMASANGAGPTGLGSVSAIHSNVDCPSGLFHFLSTGGGSREFVNAAESGLVSVECTATALVGTPATLLDERTSIAGKYPSTSFRTKSTEGAVIVFDFRDRRVQVTSYLLQHGHAEEHAALRSWCLKGSNDGKDWTLLDTRKNDTSLNGPYLTSVFRLQYTESTPAASTDKKSSTSPAVKSSAASPSALPAFRFLSLGITGPNAAGLFQIELSRIEFYGRLLA
jgi:hypothetical protein